MNLTEGRTILDIPAYEASFRNQSAIYQGTPDLERLTGLQNPIDPADSRKFAGELNTCEHVRAALDQRCGRPTDIAYANLKLADLASQGKRAIGGSNDSSTFDIYVRPITLGSGLSRNPSLSEGNKDQANADDADSHTDDSGSADEGGPYSGSPLGFEVIFFALIASSGLACLVYAVRLFIRRDEMAAALCFYVGLVAVTAGGLTSLFMIRAL